MQRWIKKQQKKQQKKIQNNKQGNKCLVINLARHFFNMNMNKEKFLKEQIKSYEKMHIASCEYVSKLEKDIKRLEKSLDDANEIIEFHTSRVIK